jgi:predicted phosphodiesterase
MRIALISDIHANLVSLEAVLEDIDRCQADQIICLGDVATLGPQPHEVVARLSGLNCPGVTGNHEASLLEPEAIQAGQQSIWAETLAWCEQQLSDDDLDYLRSFQPLIEVPLDKNSSLLCFHGSPKANTDFILPTTPDDELKDMLARQTATVMAGGHTHVQMLRRLKDVMIVNVGSVGEPFERYPSSAWEPRILPWAEYAIVSWSNGALGIELRRVPIDFGAAKQATMVSENPFDWMKYWIAPELR